MNEIPLSRGAVAVVDEDDYGWLSQWRWVLVSDKYAGRYTYSGGKTYVLYMHREILMRQGVDLGHRFVDHRDRDYVNNRKLNLRPASNSLNMRNGPAMVTSRTGRRGVTQVPGGKWRATMSLHGRSIHLGVFLSIDEAAHAYDLAAENEMMMEEARCSS